jgi:hypothetical protein
MKLRHLLIASLLLATAAAALADPVLRWDPADPLVQLGDQYTLSLTLDDTLDVRTIELFVQFDPGVVASVDGQPGALFDGFNLFQGFETVGPDQWHFYCVILGSDAWTTGPGELFRWTIDTVAEGVSPVATMQLTLIAPGSVEYTEAVLTDGQITVVDPTGVGDTAPAAPTVGLYPNPFNPRTRVQLSLPGGGPGRVDVLDMRGRVVDVPWSGTADDRPVDLDWDGCDRHGQPLPSGVYTFRLSGAGGRVASVRGVLVR